MFLGMTGKRLNRKGRHYHAAIYALGGVDAGSIYEILGDVSVCTALSSACGILGLFELEKNKRLSGKDIFYNMSLRERLIAKEKLKLIVAQKGKKLYTSTPYPKQKNK